MLEFEGINYWAVIAAWIVNMSVGAFWYSPAGFAKRWTKYTGIDILKIPTHDANRIIGFVSLSAFIQAVTLAVILNSLDISTVIEGIIATLVLWFGLVSATMVGVTLYSKRSWKFLWLNSSYFLVVMIVNAIILSAWR